VQPSLAFDSRISGDANADIQDQPRTGFDAEPFFDEADDPCSSIGKVDEDEAATVAAPRWTPPCITSWNAAAVCSSSVTTSSGPRSAPMGCSATSPTPMGPVRLTELPRFTDPVEGVASPALRRQPTRRITATDWVKDGDRWTVSKVTCDRSLTVGHSRIGRAVRLRPLMSPSRSSWATPPPCALPRETSPRFSTSWASRRPAVSRGGCWPYCST
jgi:hypothetical protein